MEDSDPLEELLIWDKFYTASLKQNSEANFFGNNILFLNCCLFVFFTWIHGKVLQSALMKSYFCLVS